MNYYGVSLVKEESLSHHGIKGQKWGLRRFQEEDGTLTEAGKARYGVSSGDGKISGVASKAKKENSTDEKKQKRKDFLKKAAVGLGAAALVGASAAALKKSTKLRDEMRDKAMQESYEQRAIQRQTASKARTSLQNSRFANDDRRSGLNSDGINNSSSAGWQQIAKNYFTASKNAWALSEKYFDISMNATRRDAVKNYIKNKGHIVIS